MNQELIERGATYPWLVTRVTQEGQDYFQAMHLLSGELRPLRPRYGEALMDVAVNLAPAPNTRQ